MNTCFCFFVFSASYLIYLKKRVVQKKVRAREKKRKKGIDRILRNRNKLSKLELFKYSTLKSSSFLYKTVRLNSRHIYIYNSKNKETTTRHKILPKFKEFNFLFRFHQ